jgi:uncharacterized protein YecE (DUF72 family)
MAGAAFEGQAMGAGKGRIHVGIGGWDFDPWRGTFYPAGLPKAKQLEYASRTLSAIEINATFYKLQSRESFARWAATVPDGFQFAIKASRFCTNRKVLGDAGEAIARFCAQGLDALGDRLGPILWQLAATKRFDPEEIAAFFDLLPREISGQPLRHAIEAAHESFRDPRFEEVAAQAGIAIARLDPVPGDGFVYARLKQSREEEALGYRPEELDALAAKARAWSGQGLDVFLFFIAGAKVRAPAAAQALLERLQDEPSTLR